MLGLDTRSLLGILCKTRIQVWSNSRVRILRGQVWDRNTSSRLGTWCSIQRLLDYTNRRRKCQLLSFR